MAKMMGVGLLCLAFFCCTNLSLARQVPKECSKGPTYWCENLKQGADCGAVGHCISTVWANQEYHVRSNAVSDKFLRLFRQLKDVKELINEDYLMNRIASECHDLPLPAAAAMCKNNVDGLQAYLYHVLSSETSPEAMCQIIGMCNNDKIDNLLALQQNKKKAPETKKQVNHKAHLVGASHCTWGPSYWCSNFSTTHECGATRHCVQRVWSQQEFPEDTDSICKICTDMVTQARAQLESNETQGELRDVFEGSCKLMPIKIVANECMKLADDFVPELVETLASEMNPQQVCSVAGLCNSARIDKLLEEHEKESATEKPHPKLLGGVKCTMGPSYWCSNFTTGRECTATKYCARKIWSQRTFATDTDSICKICTDMVTQARDQLESNETQEELKEVFEGSCKLIPIKLVAKECMKLADDFVPELVETLASEMNPQQVCSVAGLCNSARIDAMLDGYNTQLARVVSCNNCKQTALVARKKFDETSYEDFLVKLLRVCHNMGSLSDSCSMLVFKYYENILTAVRQDLTPRGLCHMSGQCTWHFHTHDLYTFPEVEPAVTDNVPCEFCEQVVNHLRDVLVANTTEVEFYKVLKGLCKQTGQFKDECLHLAEQYYPVIYQYLVADIRADRVCALMGLCGRAPAGPVAPLLPAELLKERPEGLIGADEANSYKIGRVPVPAKQTNVRVISQEPVASPLPIERMFVQVPQGKAVCSFCQYFLHYLQVELSDAKTEDEISKAVGSACDKLPSSVEDECKSFVSQYGPAVIALLVQEIDPASVCPGLGLCPQVSEVRRVAINSEKSNCPLCLFAVEQLETMLKNNHTEDNIRHALDNLCNHLSAKMKTQCVDFVDQYTNQLVEMLVANMNAQEICVFLKLCDNNVSDPLELTSPAIDKFFAHPQVMGDRNNHRGHSLLPASMLVQPADIETNEIPDDTVNGRVVKPPASPKTVCVLCEFVLKEIDDQIKDKHNDDEIKKVVHGVCKRMPKSIRSSCDDFVEKYADMVISLLAQELDPSEVCAELRLCPPAHKHKHQLHAAREEILDCAVCETVVMAVKKVLSNDRVDRNIVHVVEKACALLPAKYTDRCHTMLEIYGDSVIHLIEQYGTKGVCQKIGLCSTAQEAFVNMYKKKN